MVYGFQDEIIPLIAEALVPHFMQIEENIKVTEISQLQANLTLTVDNQSLPNSAKHIFLEQETKFVRLIFGLLK